MIAVNAGCNRLAHASIHRDSSAALWKATRVHRVARDVFLGVLAVLGVPLAYMMSTVVSGVQDASGCSGAGPITEPQWLSLDLPANAVDAGNDISTANTGFHYIEGEFTGQTANQALASLAIEVRDSSEQLVPGSASMLRTRESFPNFRAWVGWRADAVMAQGVYSAKVVAPGGNSALAVAYTLSVSADAPAMPAVPMLQPLRFGVHGMDTGEEVSCAGAPDICGTVNHYFGRDETFFPSVRLRVVPGWNAHAVFWEHHITAAPDAAPLVHGPPPQLVTQQTTSYVADSVIFPATLPAYCVTVTTTDLTSSASASAVSCFGAQSPTYAKSHSRLELCNDPPTEDLRERWCAVSANATPEKCPGVDAGSGSGGNAASGSGAGGLAGSTADASVLADGSEDRGSSCRVGAAQDSRHWLTLLSAIACAALLRPRGARSAT